MGIFFRVWVREALSSCGGGGGGGGRCGRVVIEMVPGFRNNKSGTLGSDTGWRVARGGDSVSESQPHTGRRQLIAANGDVGPSAPCAGGLSTWTCVALKGGDQGGTDLPSVPPSPSTRSDGVFRAGNGNAEWLVLFCLPGVVPVASDARRAARYRNHVAELMADLIIFVCWFLSIVTIITYAPRVSMPGCGVPRPRVWDGPSARAGSRKGSAVGGGGMKGAGIGSKRPRGLGPLRPGSTAVFPVGTRKMVKGG